MDKFKQVAFGIIAVFAVLAIVGFTILEITERPTGTFVIFAGTILTSLGTFAGLGYQQAKQTEKIDQIKTQTNGTLSKLHEDNARLNQQVQDMLKPKPDPEARTLGE